MTDSLRIAILFVVGALSGVGAGLATMALFYAMSKERRQSSLRVLEEFGLKKALLRFLFESDHSDRRSTRELRHL